MKRARPNESPLAAIEDYNTLTHDEKQRLIWNTVSWARQLYWSFDTNSTEHVDKFLEDVPKVMRDYLYRWKHSVHFNSLATEVIWKIFKSLAPTEFYHCMFVCRYWRNIVGHYVSEIPRVLLEEVGLKILQYFPHIEKLQVPQEMVDGRDLENVLHFCTKLQVLDLSKVHSVDEAESVDSISKLTVPCLAISGCEPFRVPMLKLLMSSSNHLQSLKLQSLSRHDATIRLWLDTAKFWSTNLTKLTLSGFITKDSVAKITVLTSLRKLAMLKTGLRTGMIGPIVSELPLHTLRISDSQLHVATGAFVRCTTLQVLSLKPITNDCMRLVLDLTGLTSLTLKGRRDFSEAGLVHLSRLTALQQLELITNINDFTSLTDNTTNLTSLTVIRRKRKTVVPERAMKSIALPHLTGLTQLTLSPDLKTQITNEEIWSCLPSLQKLEWRVSANKAVTIEEDTPDEEMAFEAQDDE